ncbi:MAG: AraC family transcriptional regulator [Pseudomonadota bacterium]
MSEASAILTGPEHVTLREEAVDRLVLDGSEVRKISQITAPGMDHLFAAHWFGSFNYETIKGQSDFTIVSVHRSGANVSGRYSPNGTPDVETGASLITLIPAQRWVYWRSEGDVEFTQFYIPTADLAAQAEALFGDAQIAENLELVVHHNPGIFRDLQRLHQLANANPMSALELGGWRQVIAGQVLRSFGPQTEIIRERTVKPLSAADVARVTEFMRAYIDQSFTQEDLAAELNISTFKFNRAFKEATGVTPHQHLLSLRIAKAEDLLRTTQDSLANVAYNCGFSNQAHMTMIFAKHRGVSPGRYRKMFKL